MAAVSIYPSPISTSSHLKSKLNLPYPRSLSSSLQNIPISANSKPSLSFQNFSNLRHFKFPATRAKIDDLFEEIEKEEPLLGSDGKPVKFLLLVLLWASVSIGLYAFSGDAKAAAVVAANSVTGSGFGIRVANALRASVGPMRLVSLPWLHLAVLSILRQYSDDMVMVFKYG